jgi:hypothetical protein
MPLMPPRVRSHSSSMLPTPVLTMSTLPESSASVAAPPLAKVTQLTLRVWHAEARGVALDQLPALDHVRRHVDDPRLAGDADLALLLRVSGSAEHCRERGAAAELECLPSLQGFPPGFFSPRN